MAHELEALVLRGLPGAVFSVDLEDRVTSWNVAAERLFGWSAADVLGQRLPTVPEDGWSRRRQWIERALAGEEVEVTTQRVHRDGRRIDVVLRYGPLVADDGEAAGVAVWCRDASSQLRAAARFQRNQAELALVRRLAGLVHRLQELDLNAVLNAIVEVAVDLLDTGSGVLSLEQESGRFERIANVNIPDDLESHEILPGVGIHGKVLETGRPFTVSDYDRWASAVPAFRNRGFHASVAVPVRRGERVLGVLSVHSDVPRRRFGPPEVDVLQLLAEYAAIAIANATVHRRVSAERERFLALVEAMPAGLAVVEDGVVTAWNATAETLTGRQASEVIGGPPPLDLDGATDGVELPSITGEPTRWVEATRSDLPFGDGGLYLLHDQTEQRDLERAKDLFFATTSHELKTPLTVVQGLASTLLRHWDSLPDERRVEALQTIERRAESLDRLIERILVGSRVQAGAFEVVPTPVDLVPVVEDIVAGFSAASGPAHTIVIEVPVDRPVPLVAADRQVLDTILGHLLENALKYSPDGGRISVRIDVVDADFVLVHVEDEGVGIEGDVERLLAPFVQADPRPTRRFGGVGLGLYIVHSLVEALGGSLRIEHVETGGSRFSFSVPRWR